MCEIDVVVRLTGRDHVMRPKAWDHRRVRQMRTVKPIRPAEVATRDGLAYSLWLPDGRPARGGIVILHGASSCKESHYDFARAALPLGLAAVSFDQRGHGESGGTLDGRAVADVAAMASLLRGALNDPAAPIALRGSSMGGYFALAAAQDAGAGAVVAICPASAHGLRRAVADGRFEFATDGPALDALLADRDLHDIADGLTIPVLVLHAEGDEVVPVQLSQELAPHLTHRRSRLIVVPGGHHRSIQHDGDLQAVSLRFIARMLA
jgi:alpha-beta hydrolase superfamily lysophospholipase